MPTFTSDTPRLSRKSLDRTFTVPAVFAEGHALSGPEAAWMNGALASTLLNQFGGDVRRALKAYNETAKAEFVKGGGKAKDYVEVEDPTVLGWDLQAEFDAKFAGYVLGESNRGSGEAKSTTDPITSLVVFLAKEAIKAKIKAKGLTVKAFMDAKVPTEDGGEQSKFMELVHAHIERHPELRDQAEAQLSVAKDMGDDGEDIDLAA